MPDEIPGTSVTKEEAGEFPEKKGITMGYLQALREYLEKTYHLSIQEGPLLSEIRPGEEQGLEKKRALSGRRNKLNDGRAMACDLTVTPAGCLRLREDVVDTGTPADAWTKRVAAAFSSSPAGGLFALAATRPEIPPPAHRG